MDCNLRYYDSFRKKCSSFREKLLKNNFLSIKFFSDKRGGNKLGFLCKNRLLLQGTDPGVSRGGGGGFSKKKLKILPTFTFRSTNLIF